MDRFAPVFECDIQNSITMAVTPQKPDLRAVNMAARQQVLAQALEMTQNIYSNTIANPGSSANVINVIPRNVGLIKRFTVEITATLTNTGTTSVTPTNFNIANLLSQVVFNDLQNNTRIQTAGWHINTINTMRNRTDTPYGGALVLSTGFDTPIKYGSNYNGGLFVAPASIAATASAIVKMVYEIPLAYSDQDLRGAVYANVVNATMLLQLTLNPAPIVAATADPTLAIYAGTGGAGSIVSATINVYQTFLDQLPIGNKGPILPLQDLSTIYELKNTSLVGMVQNQDFPVPYANFRDFLSTSLIWDNSPGGQAAAAGTDINYWALQAANFTNIFKIDPFLASLWVRKLAGVDMPLAGYYFDHRNKPISTIQYGNLELIQNVSAAINAGAQLLVGFEDFALQSTVSGAGSLAAG
jgi:hypothetical protein